MSGGWQKRARESRFAGTACTSGTCFGCPTCRYCDRAPDAIGCKRKCDVAPELIFDKFTYQVAAIASRGRFHDLGAASLSPID